MAGGLNFEVVTPERLLISAEIGMAIIPGREGDFGVLSGHANLVSSLRPGTIRCFAADGSLMDAFFVAGGFAEVNEASCTILAELAERLGEIDRGVAERALAEARDDLAEAKSESETTSAERRLVIAEARLAAIAA